MSWRMITISYGADCSLLIDSLTVITYLRTRRSRIARAFRELIYNLYKPYGLILESNNVFVEGMNTLYTIIYTSISLVMLDLSNLVVTLNLKLLRESSYQITCRRTSIYYTPD